MFDFLEKLRKKPEKTRRKIVAGTTAAIAVVIFALWLVATVWKIEHPQVSYTASSSLSSQLSGFIQNAKDNAPQISF